MEQRQGTSKSIKEMALRHDHFHVHIVDTVLDLFRHLHIYSRRLGEQYYQGMLRRRSQRLPLHCS
jgi:hypothetical protein